MIRHRTKLNQRAFTIVELLIATSVLSFILLISTVMITSIGNLYFKGINQARIQDDTRTITDDMSQHLQLSDQPMTTGSQTFGSYTVKSYCIQSTRYSYVTNVQIGTGSGHIAHVLWRDGVKNACQPANLTLATPSADGSEMIAPNSRLTDFTISLTSPYSISVAVAYGDDDLLNLAGSATTCKGAHNSTQFCATASLQTTAVQRIY